LTQLRKKISQASSIINSAFRFIVPRYPQHILTKFFWEQTNAVSQTEDSHFPFKNIKHPKEGNARLNVVVTKAKRCLSAMNLVSMQAS